MIFNKNTVKKTSCAAVMIAAGLTPWAASADEVNLLSADGPVNLVGEFVEFADDNYVIRTSLGELRIAASRVRCEGEACPTFETATADINIKGSDTVGLGMMPLLLSGYATFLEAEASIVSTSVEDEVLANFVGEFGFGDELGSFLITSTGSGDAFATLLDQTAQIGMSSRRIRPAEARSLRDDGAGNMVSPDQERIIAVDSLVVIVHPDNPVTELTTAQLADIYSGRVTNWSEVGGNDGPILMLSRSEGSGTRDVFEERVAGDAELNLVSTAQIVVGNNEMASTVNEDVNAIGYVGYAFQRGAKPLTLVNECGINMVPDAFSAKTEEYALQRRLYLYNRSDNLEASTSEFLDYVTSNEADGVIAKAGFIDLGISSQDQSLESARARSLLDPNVDAFEGNFMGQMLREMIDYDRLSTTFRFRTGSSNLDERGIVDMARLVDYLETAPEGTQVAFVGFTDSLGAFESNLSLSEDRARQVMQNLTALAGDRVSGIEFASKGYGEIAPSACNTGEGGRAINRRVDVWIQGS